MGVPESAFRRLPPDVLAGEGVRSMAGFYMPPQGDTGYPSIPRMDVQDLVAIEAVSELAEQSSKQRS